MDVGTVVDAGPAALGDEAVPPEPEAAAEQCHEASVTPASGEGLCARGEGLSDGAPGP